MTGAAAAATLAAVLVIALTTACSPSQPGEDPPASLSLACVERPIRAVLHVDGGDPREVWGSDLATGRDILVRARPGLDWRVDPSVPTRLVDRRGRIVTFDGEILRSACFEAATVTWLVGPQDLPDPNRAPG